MKTISFELDDDTAQRLQILCKIWGISEGELASLFAHQTIREQRAPISLSCEPDNGTPTESEDFIKSLDSGTLHQFLQEADTFTSAVVLSMLPANKAAYSLENLGKDKLADVMEIFSRGDSVSSDVYNAIVQDAHRRIILRLKAQMRTLGGTKTAVDILNLLSRNSERSVIEHLEKSDSVLTKEIKKRMFVFEDVVYLSDRDMQCVLRETDNGDVALALKGADEEVREKFFRNMSRGAAKMMKEDIEFMGPVPLSKVEEIQQKIVGTIRRLEKYGDIEIKKIDEEEVVQ